MVRRAPVFASLTLILAGAVAAAQPPLDEARAAYEAGVAHLLASRFQEAALSLERSYALRAVPIARYNLALAYRGLGRYRAAIPLFDEYLRSGAAELTPERVTAIRTERDDLSRALVDVTLRVTPTDATLRIDGGDPAPSPATLTLDPGAHVLEWTAPAHHPHRESLTATPGTRPALVVGLDPVREGRLVVESSVTSAAVLLDGARVAAGRFDREVAVGEHSLTVRADGYRPVQRRVSVSPAGTVRVVITLEREGPPGWVLPTAIAGGAVVLGGILAGVLVATQPDPPALRGGSLGTFRE